MLTGLIEPTSGSAEVFGFDMDTQMTSIREILGVCPQHNVLFPNLTVWEHLMFFGSLKSQDEDTVANQARSLLRDMNLEDKSEKRVSELSGGMKRKLSLAIAFMGQSRVVFLDEPTAGTAFLL